MKHLIFLALALFASTLLAQNTNDVTLTVVGSGKTIEEAKTNALRSAIEQAYGAFVSSNTEILNDEIVKDEIVSISSGNIKEFKILSQSELTEDLVAMTLSATVSVTQLQSYAQSKGATVEFAGGTFAMNMKLQKLNEDAELKAIKNIVTICQELFKLSYDTELVVREPYLYKYSESLFERNTFNALVKKNLGDLDPTFFPKGADNYVVPLEVFHTLNNNYQYFKDYFNTSLASISMGPQEIEDYLIHNKSTYTLHTKVSDKEVSYTFRNQLTLQSIYNFLFSTHTQLIKFIIYSETDTVYVDTMGTPNFGWTVSGPLKMKNWIFTDDVVSVKTQKYSNNYQRYFAHAWSATTLRKLGWISGVWGAEMFKYVEEVKTLYINLSQSGHQVIHKYNHITSLENLEKTSSFHIKRSN